MRIATVVFLIWMFQTAFADAQSPDLSKFHNARFILLKKEDLIDEAYKRRFKTFNLTNAIGAGFTEAQFNQVIGAGLAAECEFIDVRNATADVNGWFLGERNAMRMLSASHMVIDERGRNRIEYFISLKKKNKGQRTPCRVIPFASLLAGGTKRKYYYISSDKYVLGRIVAEGDFRADWGEFRVSSEIPGARSIPADLDHSDITPDTKFFIITRRFPGDIAAKGAVLFEACSLKGITRLTDDNGIDGYYFDCDYFYGMSGGVIVRFKNGQVVASAMVVGGPNVTGEPHEWDSHNAAAWGIALNQPFWTALEAARSRAHMGTKGQ